MPAFSADREQRDAERPRPRSVATAPPRRAGRDSRRRPLSVRRPTAAGRSAGSAGAASGRPSPAATSMTGVARRSATVTDACHSVDREQRRARGSSRAGRASRGRRRSPSARRRRASMPCPPSPPGSVRCRYGTPSSSATCRRFASSSPRDRRRVGRVVDHVRGVPGREHLVVPVELDHRRAVVGPVPEHRATVDLPGEVGERRPARACRRRVPMIMPVAVSIVAWSACGCSRSSPSEK